MVRHAFTLIELIFAIVIIAISVMSLPMMNQVIGKNIENSFAQEAIFSAIAEINIATTYVWDENSLLDILSSANELSRVVYTNGTTGDCVDSGQVDTNSIAIMKRTGHVNRRCLDTLAVSYTGTDFINSIEATEHAYISILDVNNSADSTSNTGYKKEYESELAVERCDGGTCIDFGDAGNINMKEITVTIRNASDQTQITLLRTYAANVGEVAYYNRYIP